MPNISEDQNFYIIYYCIRYDVYNNTDKYIGKTRIDCKEYNVIVEALCHLLFKV